MDFFLLFQEHQLNLLCRHEKEENLKKLIRFILCHIAENPPQTQYLKFIITT